MSIQPRQVKNKKDESHVPTHKPGTVYDVFISYKDANGNRHTYGKRGFATKSLAMQHEAEMFVTLNRSGSHKYYNATLGEYLQDWLAEYAYNYLAPSTYQGYLSCFRQHITPSIGSVKLRKLTASDIDKVCTEMMHQGYAVSSQRHAYRVLSVSLEHARKHGYIDVNPVRNSFARFKITKRTDEPYSISEVRKLLDVVSDPQMHFIVMLAALYGLRRGEIYGLQIQDIDLEKHCFTVSQQLACCAERKRTGSIQAPLKTSTSYRTLPITDLTYPCFVRQVEMRGGSSASGLLITQPDGQPYSVSHLSEHFPLLLESLQFRKIRFHDLRRSAATNMHELTGDYLTIGAILGRSFKGITVALDIPVCVPEITSQYITLKDSRKQYVLEAYHKAVYS